MAKKTFREQMEEFIALKKHFQVENVYGSKVKYVFILESPHKDELCYNCPAAGPTGAAMSKILFGNGCPLGCMIKNDYPNCEKLAIINVCQIPMQKGAYVEDKDKKKVHGFSPGFWKILGNIRLGKKTNSYADFYEVFLKKIIPGFKKKIKKCKRINPKIKFIPCGNFASLAFERATAEENNLIASVPHPARGWWTGAKNKNKVKKKLKEVIKSLNSKK